MRTRINFDTVSSSKHEKKRKQPTKNTSGQLRPEGLEVAARRQALMQMQLTRSERGGHENGKTNLSNSNVHLESCDLDCANESG